MVEFDVVSKPKHYNSHPSGLEPIEICRYLDFDLGCVFKYVIRYRDKEPVRSLKSALWYLDDFHFHRPAKSRTFKPEIARLWVTFAAKEENAACVGVLKNLFKYASNVTDRNYHEVRDPLLQLIATEEGKTQPVAA